MFNLCKKKSLLMSGLLLLFAITVTVYALPAKKCKYCQLSVNSWFCSDLPGSGGGSGWDDCIIEYDKVANGYTCYAGGNQIPNCPGA